VFPGSFREEGPDNAAGAVVPDYRGIRAENGTRTIFVSPGWRHAEPRYDPSDLNKK